MKAPILNDDALQSIIINRVLEFEHDTSRECQSINCTHNQQTTNSSTNTYGSSGAPTGVIENVQQPNGSNSIIQMNMPSSSQIPQTLKVSKRGRPKKKDTDVKDEKALQKRIYARKWSQKNKKQHENNSEFLQDLCQVLMGMDNNVVEQIGAALPQHQDMIQKLLKTRSVREK
uniref:Uncharacterized protein n=1 Tax=Panagrolaimus sp. ES5 TaxID=591445 RepID=A0AC34F3C4_9BILA